MRAVVGTYEDPRAHAVRERYLETFGGEGLPVPVEAIAEDLLGLLVEVVPGLGCSGMLVPAERRILLDADEATHGETPIRRHRFTVAHELGHWVCHCLEGRAPAPERAYCRPIDLTEATDRALEREANVFAAELLMPEAAVRETWAQLVAQSHEGFDPVAACARRFDVSRLAMQWRLYSFDLVEKPMTT